MGARLPNNCTRCGEVIKLGREVFLALDTRTNTYTLDELPPEYDQGGFPFGRACAKRALAENHSAVRP